MNKSRYKLYKQGKKWVITAVAATSIGIGGYALTSPNLVHADTVPISSLAGQSLVNDSEFYKIADRLSMAAKNTSIRSIDDEPKYESFKSALAAYEIIKDIHSIMCNDLSIIARSNTGIPYYLTENQLDSLKMRFNDINSSMMDADRDNTKVLDSAADYVNVAANITRMYGYRTYEPIGSSGSPVGSVSSKFGTAANSASSAISSVISSYNAYKNGPRYSQSSFSPFASSAPAASENVIKSTPNKDASYWQNVANSLSSEMSKKSNADSVSTFTPSSSTETSAASSTATSVTSSATSSAATSSSSTDSSAVSSSADPAYTPSFANNSNNSSVKHKNDVYKNFYLSLKKKAAKDVASNKNRVAKYQKEYKLTKNKQQKAKKLKQYRDAKHKLNASQKHLKSINAKSLK